MKEASALALTAWMTMAIATTAQEIPERLGSVEAYLLDERYEVALARSAAPEHIGAAARVLVLRRDGYHEVERGSNGFTCLVERSWSSPIGLHADFFNPRLRAPICYNAEGSRTVLGDFLRRTELALAGKTISEIARAIEADLATGRLRAPRGVAMSYMLSGGQLLGTRTGRYKPHVMFYVAYATGEQLGSNPGQGDHPVMFEHEGGPLAAIVVPVARFNDAPPEPPR